MGSIDNFTALLDRVKSQQLLMFVKARAIPIPDFYDIETLVFFNDAFGTDANSLNNVEVRVIDRFSKHRGDGIDKKEMGGSCAADTKAITAAFDICVIFIQGWDTLLHPEEHSVLNARIF
jgi:hypothetical protein